MMLRRPPDLLPTAAVAAAAVLLQLTVLVVGPRLGSAPKPELAEAFALLDYAAEPFLSLPRLAKDFVASALGDEVGDVVFRPKGSVGNASEPEPSPGGTAPPTPAPSPPSIIPESVRTDVEPSMSVDRTQAARGDTLLYTIRVRNTSDNRAKVRITSHIPEHTQFVEGDPCPGGPVSADENPNSPAGYTVNVCSETGPPAPGEHGVLIDTDIGPQREQTFTFKVLIGPDAPVGSTITNHAHVSGPTTPARISNEVRTRVGA